MEISVIIKIKIPDKKVLESTLSALLPETIQPPTERSKSYIERKNQTLIIQIVANDLTSIRASVNSYLKWLVSISKSLEVIQNRAK